jgi:hypothetical protein
MVSLEHPKYSSRIVFQTQRELKFQVKDWFFGYVLADV